jgi:multidrug transporter EmrE-like cation transporter
MTPAASKRNPKLSVALVFLCTVLGAAAQILMKNGTQGQSADGLVGLLVAIFSNRQLFLGYALYGLSTVVLVIALKYGELSILYPVIALTYVWVTALSVMIYGEQLNPFKLLGLATVIAGVVVIGFGMRRKPA